MNAPMPAECAHAGCHTAALPDGDLCLPHQRLYEDWSGCPECIARESRCRECAESLDAEARVDAILDGDY